MFEQAIGAMASVIVDPYLLGLIFVTTILGVIIGVLPGLGATTGAALLLPFTLTMDPVHAIAVLATIYVSATFAGSITAILINAPGTSAAAATTFDGYPLAQKGEAGRALGVAVISSTVGGIFSVLVLCFAAPLLARVAYEFRSPEYFALTVFGLSMLASISAGGAVKNLMGGIFGVWLSTIGAERVTGIERFMFGNYELYEGLHFVPIFIGLIASMVKTMKLAPLPHTATHSALMTIQHIIKVIVFGFIGFNFSDYVFLIMMMIFTGFIGTYLGRIILISYGQRYFKFLLNTLLIIISGHLIISGVTSSWV